MSSRTLFLIDGHSQVFKAYHAIRQLSTSTGIPTNAVFGFTQILHKLFKTRKPEHMAVVFDSGKPTFRHEMYEAYKANRDAPPEDFGQQMEYIYKILDGLRIPILKLPGFEADDIIATVARSAAAQDYDVWVVTADKDLFQLVNDQVKVLRLDPDNEIEFDREAVKVKMGVYPEQIGDLLAMIGDSSDNIPGIPRVGPKTATTLLEQYGSLEAVLANTASLKGKQREYVEAGTESARLSRKLVELCYDVPVEFTLDCCVMQPPDVAALAPLYRELEFRKLFEDLKVAPTEQTQARYRLINTEEALAEYCARILQAGFVALDVESDSLETITANLVGISLALAPGDAVYIPVGHVGAMGSEAEVGQLSLETVQRLLGPLLLNPVIRKIAHNAKFDWRMLHRHGLNMDRIAFDTLIASYLINADRRAHGLKDLSSDLLGIRMTRIEELIGSGKHQITFAEVEIEPAVQYAAADADMTLQLEQLLEPRVDDCNARELLEKIELPLVPVLMQMEECGVCIDEKHFAELAVETNAHLERIRTQIYAAVGHEFNIGSPKQVAMVLFEELQLKPGKSKKTGYSTDIEVLEELALTHEVPRMLAEYRQFEKLKSTYVDVLPTLLCPATNRIHTNYNQAVAATGRLSSSDPNLQNIPIRTEFGRKIRQGFVPCSRNNVLLAADYSQIELRVLAHVTRDEALMDAYRAEIDIHTLTASKVFGMDVRLVTDEMRAQAKMVNFGIIYGMGPQGLSTRLKIPFATARVFIEEYFRGYAGVRRWLDATLADAKVKGYVETVSGRRRYLPDINSRNFNARNSAERMATNAPIQGTSADMIKIAMINIHRRLKQEQLKTCMIMQVHDELIFDTPESELEHVQALVRDEMQNALPLDVPVKVELGHGKHWAAC